MQINRFLKTLLIFIIFLSLLVSAFVVHKRIIIEKENNVVEIALDYSDIEKLSKSEGVPLENILKTFSDIGVKTIALCEDTLDRAEERGDLFCLPGYTLLNAEKVTGYLDPFISTIKKKGYISPTKFYIFFNDENYLERVSRELKLSLGESQIKRLSQKVIEITADEEVLFSTGIGIPQNVYISLKKKGIKIITRLKPNRNLKAESIPKKLNLQGIMADDDLIIFDGDEVLGYPKFLSVTARELKARGLKYGYIEFSQQLGGEYLAKLLGENTVRVHSITPEEMEIISQDVAIPRWLRAARERGIRLFYIHTYLPQYIGGSAIDTNVSYVKSILKELKRSGFEIGRSKEFKRLDLGIFEVLMIAMGISAGGILLLSNFVPVTVELAVSIILLSIFYILFSRYYGYIVSARKAFALSSAIVFPTLAVVFSYSDKGLNKQKIANSLFAVAKVFLISLVGAILIVGLLSTTSFMIGADYFSGVKIAFLIPLFLISMYFFLKEEDTEKLSFTGRFKKLTKFLNINITVLHVIILLFLTGFILIFILRSGNFGIGVFDFERSFRNLLEKILIARPRNKEFLVGYPILFLSALFYHKLKDFLWISLPLGAVASVSLVNTFCHIHSPVIISTIRSINGLIFGIIIGFLLGVLIDLYLKIVERFNK